MVSTSTDYIQETNYSLLKNLELECEIQELNFEATIEKKKAQQQQRYLLCALFLMPLVLLVVQNKKVKSVELNYTSQQFSKEISTLTDKLAQIEKTQTHAIKYITQPGDNLAKIGNLFFNDAKAGYRVAADNKLHVTDLDVLLFPNDTLTIVYH